MNASTTHTDIHKNQTIDLETRAIRRISFRLIPFMFVLYIIAYLDRVNVGFAALQMNTDLGLSHAVFGWGSGIFFIGYFLFEIPSNIILHRIGARVWIARIMISWGIMASAMMLVTGPKSFYVLRFLLGFAEAGFFPGMVLYLTYWFPQRYLARNVALFMTATPLAGVIGGPVSGALLQMHGVHGLSGWQWLFLLEGLPAVFFGLAVFFYLPDRPEKSVWLPDDEKTWLQKQLERDAREKAGQKEQGLWRTLSSGRVWILSLIYFSLVFAMYGIALWMPLMLEAITGFGSFFVGIISIFPYLAAAGLMVVIGHSSDRTGERRWHMAGSLTLAACGFFCPVSFMIPSAVSSAW